MAAQGVYLDDPANKVGLTVTDAGKFLRVSFVEFTGVRMSAEVLVPKSATRDSFKKFIRRLRENEDVYLELIAEYCGEPEECAANIVSIVQPKTKVTKRGSIRASVLKRG